MKYTRVCEISCIFKRVGWVRDQTGSLAKNKKIRNAKMWNVNANSQLTLRCCGNVVNVDSNIVGTLAPTLWQHSLVDTFKCLSNILWTCRQRCVNIVPMLYFDKNHNVDTICHNFAQHCNTVAPKSCECCVNVVAMSVPNIGE